MDADRLEKILALLRKGLRKLEIDFTSVNIGSVLEEICTNFVRNALEENRVPGFVEAGTALQECAELYASKVDHLCENAIQIYEALRKNAEEEGTENAEQNTPSLVKSSGKRRPRAPPEQLPFEHIVLTECAGATQAPGPPRPPPTLPRHYIELEPRLPTQHDATLRDYRGDSLGLLSDFHVSLRLQDGFLTDDLSEWNGASAAPPQPLQALSLQELRRALHGGSVASPPASPPRAWTPPLGASTPLPPAAPPAAPPPAAPRRARARRASAPPVHPALLGLHVSAELEAWLDERREFAPEPELRRRVLAGRTRRILELRLSIERERDFRGFEDEYPDAGGFRGWSEREARESEAAAARILVERAKLNAVRRVTEADSEDDGFFERSSFTGSDHSRAERFARPPPPPDSIAARYPKPPPTEEDLAFAAEMAAWGARAAERAAAAEARDVFDAEAQNATLLATLPVGGVLSAPELLARTVAEPHEVSRVLLATLFLANSGNVEIERGAPGTVNSFSVRLLSRDRSAMRNAAEAVFAHR